MTDERFYIHTIGCQMNVYDSDRMAELLKPLGYSATDRPEGADLIVVNTCAIRAKAEQKVFSYLGRLAELKRRKPDLIVAVGGCVAQQEGRKILERVPTVDLVFGTGAIGRLPENVLRVRGTRRRLADLDMLPRIEETARACVKGGEDGRVTRFVTIMQGCDNHCTYCVVPHVRGREISRRPEHILQEITGLVVHGVREVTLLGQNVNSYNGGEESCTFPVLLARIARVEGLDRIRFTTSHPKDLSEDLIRAFGTLEKLCRHIHLPVQSGSDRVLRRMNRGYTRELYVDRVRRLRRHCPDIAISSDFIVGFPGETDSDFDDSLNLIQEVGFDSLFAFLYSDRPNAPARRFSGKIAEDVKNLRLQRLLDLQKTMSADGNRSLVGKVRTVLVEGSSKRSPVEAVGDNGTGRQWSGRTTGNKIVNFVWTGTHGSDPADPDLTGRLIRIRIERALSHSLWGRPLAVEQGSFALKGAHHAA